MGPTPRSPTSEEAPSPAPCCRALLPAPHPPLSIQLSTISSLPPLFTGFRDRVLVLLEPSFEETETYSRTQWDLILALPLMALDNFLSLICKIGMMMTPTSLGCYEGERKWFV